MNRRVHMRLAWICSFFAVMPGAAIGTALAGYPGAPDPHPGLQALSEQQAPQPASGSSGPLELELLGFLSFFDQPFTVSDVWAHGKYAYVGGFGAGTPVRIVDISDPTNPWLVQELFAPPGSSPQDVKVAKIKTRHFKGDLLVVGNDGGAPPTFGGIQLWDVSDPTAPVLLSEPRFGPVHNTYLYQKGNRAFVLLAIPLAEVFSGPSPFEPVIGDFAIVEVTDPSNPVLISDWTAGRDGGFPFGFPGFPGACTPCRGASPAVLCHDVWADKTGTVAYLSYWDLGVILLDISDPENPQFLSRGIEPTTFGNDEGNAHNAVPAKGGELVLVTDEDFGPAPGSGGQLPWGFLRLFETEDEDDEDGDDPVQVGAYATDGTLNDPTPVRTIHNVVVRGTRAFISWYSEGLRVIDFSDPSNPAEIAAFSAPPGTSLGVFWGVHVHHNLLLGSDISGGLFILGLPSGDDEDGDDESDDD